MKTFFKYYMEEENKCDHLKSKVTKVFWGSRRWTSVMDGAVETFKVVEWGCLFTMRQYTMEWKLYIIHCSITRTNNQCSSPLTSGQRQGNGSTSTWHRPWQSSKSNNKVKKSNGKVQNKRQSSKFINKVQNLTTKFKI